MDIRKIKANGILLSPLRKIVSYKNRKCLKCFAQIASRHYVYLLLPEKDMVGCSELELVDENLRN